jgi:hypothetical protein
VYLILAMNEPRYKELESDDIPTSHLLAPAESIDRPYDACFEPVPPTSSSTKRPILSSSKQNIGCCSFIQSQSQNLSAEQAAYPTKSLSGIGFSTIGY